MKTIKILSVLFCLNILVIFAFSQSVDPAVISSAGNYVETGNSSVSYTVGQTITATLSNGNIVTQGFQQDDYTIVEIPEESIGEFNVNVYPIPATNELTVEFSDDISQGVTICLYDELGKTILIKKMTTTVNKIDIGQLADSYYFLKITNQNSSKTFKIQKNK